MATDGMKVKKPTTKNLNRMPVVHKTQKMEAWDISGGHTDGEDWMTVVDNIVLEATLFVTQAVGDVNSAQIVRITRASRNSC